MPPARPFCESLVALESLWVWDPCSRLCNFIKKNSKLKKKYFDFIYLTLFLLKLTWFKFYNTRRQFSLLYHMFFWSLFFGSFGQFRFGLFLADELGKKFGQQFFFSGPRYVVNPYCLLSDELKTNIQYRLFMISLSDIRQQGLCPSKSKILIL